MTNSIKYSDSELIEKLIEERDSRWFAILYDRHSSKVFNKCITLLQNKEVAKDLTHDIFIKAFVNISKFEGKSSFFTWLYAITYNMCIDYLRKSNVYSEMVADDEAVPDVLDDIDDAKLLRIELDRLKILLEEIPNSDKIVLLMKYQDDMSIREIGDIFNLGDSAIKMRICRAKKKVIELYNIRYRHSVYYLDK